MLACSKSLLAELLQYLDHTHTHTIKLLYNKIKEKTITCIFTNEVIK